MKLTILSKITPFNGQRIKFDTVRNNMKKWRTWFGKRMICHKCVKARGFSQKIFFSLAQINTALKGLNRKCIPFDAAKTELQSSILFLEQREL